MRNRKKILKYVGSTLENKPVVSGVFDITATLGVPLEEVLAVFKIKGLVVDWAEYVANALAENVKISNIKSKIESAVGEIYGPTYREAVMHRLKTIM